MPRKRKTDIKKTGAGDWQKNIDRRRSERLAHIKLAAVPGEDRDAFRERVRAVLGQREAMYRRGERDKAAARGDLSPRTVVASIRWIPGEAAAHVIIDAKG